MSVSSAGDRTRSPHLEAQRAYPRARETGMDARALRENPRMSALGERDRASANFVAHRALALEALRRTCSWSVGVARYVAQSSIRATFD